MKSMFKKGTKYCLSINGGNYANNKIILILLGFYVTLNW